MKHLLLSIATILLVSLTSYGKNIYSTTVGDLNFALDDNGEISVLQNKVDGKNYLVPKNPSYLMTFQYYDSKKPVTPKSAKILKKKNKDCIVKLSYADGTKLLVKIESKKSYLRMELMKVDSPEKIEIVNWQYNLAMHGPRAEWVSLARSDDFTIGLMPITISVTGDGGRPNGAIYQNFGTTLKLCTYDQTTTKNRSGEFRHTPLEITPLPDVSVLHSAVVLFGCQHGKENELNHIEQIEAGENLPHLTWKGTWIKRSPWTIGIRIRAHHNPADLDKILEISKKMGAISIIQFQGFFKNWGHFDVDEKQYPGGWAQLREDAKKCKANGLDMGFYTLTHFIKPKTGPEPFISPVPDLRLAHFTMRPKLTANINATTKTIRINYDEKLAEVWGKHANWGKALRIGNEIIEAESFEISGHELILKNVTRGQYMTTPTAHKKNATTLPLLLAGYHNLFPGTEDMYEECARIQTEKVCNNGLQLFSLDGFGEVAGHGSYTKNHFLDTIYKVLKENKHECILTGSPSQTIYGWHHFAVFSWGEFDLKKGFRGTMLDYRIHRQLQLENNLYQHQMGQYYPDDKTTLEDFEWLLARMAGWNSGVDLHIQTNKMPKNPEYEAICNALVDWMDAIRAGAFTEKQKLGMRQTDRLYHLTKLGDKKWKAEFVKFWRSDKMKLLPPSAIKIDGASSTVMKNTCDWLLGHDPGIVYYEAAVSDDMIHKKGATPTEWTVTFPRPEDDKAGKKQNLNFVIRLPANAPSAVKNIKIKVQGHELTLPVTLNPGEYIANPNSIQRAFVYDGKTHQIKREFWIPQFNPYWFLPTFEKGKPTQLSITCEPIKAGRPPILLLNIFLHQTIYKK